MLHQSDSIKNCTGVSYGINWRFLTNQNAPLFKIELNIKLSLNTEGVFKHLERKIFHVTSAKLYKIKKKTFDTI